MSSTDAYTASGERTGDHNELIPVGKAAKILGVSVSTMQRYDREGRVKAQRTPITNQRRYRRGDIEALWEATNSPEERAS